MKSFDYHEARNIPEVLELLASGDDVRILAGGCGILSMMKQKIYWPSALVNIKKIEGLKYVRRDNGNITIGTLATQSEVRDSPVVRDHIPLLAKALDFVATDRIRNMATVGGTIAHADPNSDIAPALLVLDSRVVIRGPDGTREVPLARVYVDYFETTIQPNELLESIVIPIPASTSRAIYTRFQLRKSMDKAMPGVAVLVDLDEDCRTIRTIRIGMSGVGSVCIRLNELEEFLTGKGYNAELGSEVSNRVEQQIDPVSEYHYTAEYKKAIAGIMLKRAVAEAVLRAAER